MTWVAIIWQWNHKTLLAPIKFLSEWAFDISMYEWSTVLNCNIICSIKLMHGGENASIMESHDPEWFYISRASAVFHISSITISSKKSLFINAISKTKGTHSLWRSCVMHAPGKAGLERKVTFTSSNWSPSFIFISSCTCAKKNWNSHLRTVKIRRDN